MTRKKEKPRRAKKLPYKAPKLTVHGDLRTLTQVTKGGAMMDGGKPQTRQGGTSG